ncbi:MAG: type IX secretion system membrane protein PorP/SprF, partial [Flavobacteriaceae bacterium]
MKRTFITFSLLALSFMGTRAQQDAQYTQYMYNTLAVNPAYAGSRGL